MILLVLVVVVVYFVVDEGVVVVWPKRDLGQNNIGVNAGCGNRYCQDLLF